MYIIHCIVFIVTTICIFTFIINKKLFNVIFIAASKVKCIFLFWTFFQLFFQKAQNKKVLKLLYNKAARALTVNIHYNFIIVKFYKFNQQI